MPAKKKIHQKTLNPITRLKRSHKSLHKLFVFTAIIIIWKAIWTLLDHLFVGIDPVLAALVSMGLALMFLLLDDFHLKELER